MNEQPNWVCEAMGLRAYAPGEFDRVHAPGAMKLTASRVPALFEQDRFTGRFGLACHMLGRVPFADGSNELMLRGLELEEINRSKTESYLEIPVHSVGGYAQHPQLADFLASPDMWALCPDRGYGVGEGKIVAGMIFQNRWLGKPPLDVELQIHAQVACAKRADWAFCSAFVIGDFRWDHIVYEVPINRDAVAIIEDTAGKFLDMLRAGDLPEPDTHRQSLQALSKIYPDADPGEIIELLDETSAKMFDQLVHAKAQRRRYEIEEEEAKDYFKARMKGAGQIDLEGDRRLKIAVRSRAAHTVKASRYKTIEPFFDSRVTTAPIEIG